ncbi:ABC transporter permease [Nocardioides sp. GY 10127]|uniref:ABC transporter permease n=1 Tax=Nocardioides sp. GY 10127 TaxID=2569762 RepID=UPI0010A83D0B|nr:ABC transporter permease [Nocardioides sp. GY 10127]TIC79118.1 ABC transporter permease [Nocardioides sp. GY 10127]
MTTLALPSVLPRGARERFRSVDPVALVVGAVCALLVLLAVVGPMISGYDSQTGDILHAGEGPSAAHWFGTDALGRDIFTRAAVGARLSLVAPAVCVLIAAAVATVLALVSSWFGGWVDTAITRGLDIVFAFPSLLFALIAIAIFGTGITAPVIALSIAYVPYLARVARVTARRERHAAYITAGTLQGLAPSRVAIRHLLPSMFPVIRTQATIMYGSCLTDLAGISFLGLGVQPPVAEWGSMVNEGRTALLDGHPEEALFPGLLIVVTVVAFNLLAERFALREDRVK